MLDELLLIITVIENKLKNYNLFTEISSTRYFTRKLRLNFAIQVLLFDIKCICHN